MFDLIKLSFGFVVGVTAMTFLCAVGPEVILSAYRTFAENSWVWVSGIL